MNKVELAFYLICCVLFAPVFIMGVYTCIFMWRYTFYMIFGS
jgi:hypothetical protein